MATIRERNGKYCVIYNYIDDNRKRRQKWETYKTKAEALRRKREIEFKKSEGSFIIPQCNTMKDLLKEYVELYGKDKWSVSTYGSNTALIRNYILPMIGNTALGEVNTRFLEKYYQKLLNTTAVRKQAFGKKQKNGQNKCVSTSTVRDIHKLLRNCLEQAVKWELIDKNPAVHATVPKHKQEKRDIWTAETLMRALDACDDKVLALALNLSFAGSLRMGELLGLTWDCVDVSEESVRDGMGNIYINKELQRVTKESLKNLDGKDILFVFPEESKRCTTVRVLKTPKTESSVRKVFLPASVAAMLQEHKKEQEELQAVVGTEYHDYNLVMATSFGMPQGDNVIRNKLKRLIREHDLPDVVFHSIRHTSVTYKLKLNGGDIKSVQGDSGHSQVNMVTDVYSHIIDEDRKRNAQLFEDAFYGRKNLDPKMHEDHEARTVNVPEDVDADLLANVLTNPEMKALLISLAKAMGKSG